MSQVLLIDDCFDRDPLLKHAIAEQIPGPILVEKSVQDGIERLEAGNNPYTAVVCRYSGMSGVLTDALTRLVAEAKLPCLLLNDKRAEAQPASFPNDRLIVLPLKPAASSLREGLARLQKPASSEADREPTPDADFIRFNSRSVDTAIPIQADVYAKLTSDHYIKIYRSDDVTDAKELQRELEKRRISHYYIRRDQIRSTLQAKTAAVDLLIQQPSPDRDQVASLAEDVVEITQDVVSKIGFTPEIQEVVKRTAQMVVKLISKDANLSRILTRLNENEKRYIASHSMMLGEVGCAIAHRVGWDSPSTYLKISLSALMHDIPFKDNALARVNRLTGPEAPQHLTQEQLNEIKLHPVRAAEYAHQFSEMPPDVDSILSQHHERPDGTGFPRGLFHSRIHPLAALFIMAHEVLDEFMAGRPIASIEKFMEERVEIYSQGTFKKIAQAVIQGRELK